MGKEFDIEEIARRYDKNIFLVYYDEALTNRNFIIKLRALLANKQLSLEELKTQIILLDDELKIQHSENFKKHFLSNNNATTPKSCEENCPQKQE